MADTDWNACLGFVLSAEGSYSDNPLDPGGATNLGITLSTLSQWRHTAVTKDDVRNLSTEEAAAIYRSIYWNASRCSDLPAGVDLMIFDASVNLGNGRSARILQAAVGVTVDGSIGPETLAAVRGRVAADQRPVRLERSSSRVRYHEMEPGYGTGVLGQSASG